ncbi:MAG TPA: amino acid ABC transporter permease [Acidimicrobiia bacterium]|nr:amino acid ABC transporter permease [Acidimicrobiia bacterium]
MATLTAAPVRPPLVAWVRRHLLSGPLNTLLTLVFGAVFVAAGMAVVRFLANSDFTILRVNLALFMVGGFRRDELWRIAVAAWLLSLMGGLVGGLVAAAAAARARQTGVVVTGATGRGRWSVLRRFWPFGLFLVICLSLTETIQPTLVTVLGIGLAVGGYWLARRWPASWRRFLYLALPILGLAAYGVMASSGLGWSRWGGFHLNLFLTGAGLLLAFPFGILLALGRRSSLPVVKGIAVGYIEVIRGVPLITLLLMGVFALGFFLPSNLRPSDVTRVLVAITLFEAAYIAEVVRGGLQAVPSGQTEAAQALGLSPWKITRLIVLPQALRATIPAMVGQFISLFKDTTLVAAVGLGDVLAASSFANSQPAFNAQGLARITLPFVALAFWAGSYTMSREAKRLERRLGVGER